MLGGRNRGRSWEKHMESLLTLADGGLQRRILLNLRVYILISKNTYMGQHLKGTKGYLIVK